MTEHGSSYPKARMQYERTRDAAIAAQEHAYQEHQRCIHVHGFDDERTLAAERLYKRTVEEAEWNKKVALGRLTDAALDPVWYA